VFIIPDVEALKVAFRQARAQRQEGISTLMKPETRRPQLIKLGAFVVPAIANEVL
jgi:hypothetical protein